MDEFEPFARWMREHDYSDVTVRGYLADLRDFARWYEQTNGRRLTQALTTPGDVRDYRAWLQRRCSVRTVRRRLMALRAWMRWGVASGRIGEDPTRRLRLPAEVPLGPRWLERGEQWALEREAERAIAAANTPQRKRLAVRDWAMVVFLLRSGLRVSEACSLRVRDVEIGERSGWVQVSGKGDKARRIPLNAEARHALRRWLDARGEGQGESLFGVSPAQFHRRLAALGRRAGVPAVHPHALRHTFAKNLLDAGAGLHEAAALLGHSSLNATRVYIAPAERDLERAVGLLD